MCNTFFGRIREPVGKVDSKLVSGNGSSDLGAGGEKGPGVVSFFFFPLGPFPLLGYDLCRGQDRIQDSSRI